MDTSETYIKMWKAAGFNEAPRQDQLQEMVANPYPKFWRFTSVWTYEDKLENRCTYVCGVGEYLDHDFNVVRHPYLSLFTSMEQLWLAFVMKEKYNKTWDGEKWVI